MTFHYESDSNSFFGKSQNIESLGQVMWHITNRCNLNCAFCFTRAMRPNRDEVTLQTVDRFIPCLLQLGVKKIDLSGGEPLLYSHLPELVERCRENGIAVTITTSGSGSEDTIAWVCEHWDLFSRVIVSLDGPEPLHNRLRGSSSPFSACLNFISELNRHHCTNLRINTVVTAQLLHNEQAKELCRVIQSVNPEEWCLVEPYSINKTDQFDALTVSPDSFDALCRAVEDTLGQTPVKLICRHAHDYQSYWALYVDGLLYYSHNGLHYDVSIPLSEENLPRIRQLVASNRQIYINTGGAADESYTKNHGCKS